MKKYITFHVIGFLLVVPFTGVWSQIQADFLSNNLEGCNTLQTTFLDQSTSTSSIIDWTWDINGNNSFEQNPSSFFTTPGNYTICLTVTDVDGNSDTECKEDYIKVFPEPTAAFSLDANEGCIPFDVTYINESSSPSGEIVSWIWSVGGSQGVVSKTDTSPVVTQYTTGGIFGASLTIEDEKGCVVTTVVDDAVSAISILEPNISAVVESTCSLPWEVTFSNFNIDENVTYTWDFGNGTTFIGPNPPTVTYDTEGSFSLNIYLDSGICRDTFSSQGFINTNSPTQFSVSEEIICLGESITFIDESLVVADSIRWVFGDGTESTEIDPSHMYTQGGCYDIQLIRYTGACIDQADLSCIMVLDQSSLSFDITNQFDCSVPTDVVLNADLPQGGSFTWQFLGQDGTQIVTDTNNVIITIEEFGLNYANLRYIAPNGCETFIDSIPIQIEPIGDLLPSIGPEGCAPLTFTLQDAVSSPIPIVSWEWVVGDPAIFTSNASNPTFTVQDTGRFDLTLSVENANGCVETIIFPDYIRVGMMPQVDFTATPIEDCLIAERFFTDLSSSFADFWIWDFGDETTSFEQNPSHIYSSLDSFDITLTAFHNGCGNTVTFTEYLNTLEPLSSFAIDYSCDDPFTVNLSNRSIGADSLFWTIYTTQNDSIIVTDSLIGEFTFADRGDYVIRHYSYSEETECEHISTDTIRIREPIASFDIDTLMGCAPISLNLTDLSQDADKYIYQSIIGSFNIDTISSPTLTIDTGGIYTGPSVIITDIHECMDTFQFPEDIIINQLISNFSLDNVICIPDSIQLIDESVSVLSNITNWNWSIPQINYSSIQQNNSIAIDSAGLYDVTLITQDDFGCIDTSFQIRILNAIDNQPDFLFDSLGCTWSAIRYLPQNENDFIDNYLWDFGDGTTSTERVPTHLYQSEGIYSVCLTMSDARGCSKQLCKEDIIEIKDPMADFTADPTSATCPPLLTNFTNQSVNANSYTWDFGANSGISVNENPATVYTSPGIYTVSLIAELTPNCRDTLTVDDLIDIGGPIGDISLEVKDYCLPVEIELNANSDDEYQMVWDLGNGVLDSVPGLVNMSNINYFYESPGKFTPKLLISDSNNCTRSFAVDQVVVEDFTLAFSTSQDTFCGLPLSLELTNESTGTTDMVDYSWNVIGPNTFTSENVNPVFDITESGTYSVSLIGMYNSCVDTIDVDQIIEISENPMVSFEVVSEELCEGVTVTFDNNSISPSGNFVEWLWDFGDGSTSTEQSPTHMYEGVEGRTITLTGFTDIGCSNTFTSSFDVLPSTIALVEEDKVICIGDETSLKGEIINLLDGGDFYWEDDPSLSCTDCLEPVASPLETTTFVFVGIHPNGCESRDSVMVTVIPTPGPELSITADSIICLGNSATLSIDNFDNNLTYVWADPIDVSSCGNFCETVSVSPEEQTTYFIRVENQYGCFNTASIVVDVESEIEDFLLDSRGICEGDSTTLNVTGGNNPQWFGNGNTLCDGCAEINISLLKDQYYFVNVQSDLGCFYQDSILVEVISLDSIDAGLDVEICVGESVQLSGQGPGDALWESPDGFSSTEKNISFSPEESSVVTLLLTYDECVLSDSLFVTVEEKAEISAVGDTICVGEEALIFADGKVDEIIWVDFDQIGDDVQIVNPEITTDYLVIGNYRTCEPDSAISTVYVHPEIDYVIPETFYELFLNNEVNITPTFDETRAYSYEWSPSTGLDCDDCPDPTITGLDTHVDYSLLVTDDETNCTLDENISVRFNRSCTNTVFHIPNVFAPDGGGLNTEWQLKTNNIDEFLYVSIFDRYGNKVFYTDDLQTSWNGRFNNQPVVSGVYVYKIDLICEGTDETYSIFGDVTVLR